MDISTAKEKIKQVTKELIESTPEAHLGIMAALLVDALVEEINEHIADPDDQVVYDLF